MSQTIAKSVSQPASRYMLPADNIISATAATTKSAWPLGPKQGSRIGATPTVRLNTQGKPGPGVGATHLAALQAAADADGIAYVVHGSRQTGVSFHSGKPFAPDTDLDLGVLSDVDFMNAASWESIPDADHPPMRIFDGLADALKNDCVVVMPRRR